MYTVLHHDKKTGLVGALLGRVFLQPGVTLPRLVVQAAVVAGDGLHHVGGPRGQAAATVLAGVGRDYLPLLPVRHLPGAGMGFRLLGCGVVGHHADRARG